MKSYKKIENNIKIVTDIEKGEKRLQNITDFLDFWWRNGSRKKILQNANGKTKNRKKHRKHKRIKPFDFER